MPQKRVTGNAQNESCPVLNGYLCGQEAGERDLGLAYELPQFAFAFSVNDTGNHVRYLPAERAKCFS